MRFHTLQSRIRTASLALGAWLYCLPVRAQIYQGGSLSEGTDEARQIVDSEGSLRETVINIVQTVLSYLALIAVVVIVIAGIRLVVSMGEEEQKEKAKRTIIYAIIGLIVILLAKGIVTLIANLAN